MSLAQEAIRTVAYAMDAEREIESLRARFEHRVAEIIEANNRMRDERTQARRERDYAQALLRAVTVALVKAETERDDANRLLQEWVARNPLPAPVQDDDTMSLEDGTEPCDPPPLDRDAADRAKIKAFFEANPGKKLFPCDVADALGLAYGRSALLCGQLADAGEIPLLEMTA
jgi:hypothetical protein